MIGCGGAGGLGRRAYVRSEDGSAGLELVGGERVWCGIEIEVKGSGSMTSVVIDVEGDEDAIGRSGEDEGETGGKSKDDVGSSMGRGIGP